MSAMRWRQHKAVSYHGLGINAEESPQTLNVLHTDDCQRDADDRMV
jgi:hypothetical protein